MFVKYYTHQVNADYPDFGVSFETYTNDVMLELETLSPLTLIEPGASIEHKDRSTAGKQNRFSKIILVKEVFSRLYYLEMLNNCPPFPQRDLFACLQFSTTPAVYITGIESIRAYCEHSHNTVLNYLL